MKAGNSQLIQCLISIYSDPKFNLQHRNRNEGREKRKEEKCILTAALYEPAELCQQLPVCITLPAKFLELSFLLWGILRTCYTFQAQPRDR